MTRVPGSKHQDHLRRESQRVLAPAVAVKHLALCRILQVFDQETLESQEPPAEVLKKIQQAPGLLFVRVQTIPSGRTLYLPLKDPEDLVHQVFGNASQINGRMGKIEYENLSMENGRVLIQRGWDLPMLNLRSVTTLADIGRII